ncbi:hypothetical protein [Phenylobacterium sp.]|uniref:hypothetical protein n=1 Tax=Phenylobacterium sp. TaxID=1871053 RepID=UPI002CF3FF9D|nr:hypothetical protein [Phenylobacterium sp.]HVI31361.1 hypothetical protein [Phenylobacterium sp.]
MRIAALLSLGLLAGCATTSTVDATTALSGRELDTALNLYGRWDERIVLADRPHYVWRRAVLLNGRTYYCELRTEVAFRNTISAVTVEGYPAACSLFEVQYKSAYDAKATPEPPKTAIVAARNFRPVGGADSATGASRDASARPREQAAGLRGS